MQSDSYAKVSKLNMMLTQKQPISKSGNPLTIASASESTPRRTQTHHSACLFRCPPRSKLSTTLDNPDLRFCNETAHLDIMTMPEDTTNNLIIGLQEELPAHKILEQASNIS